MDAKAAAPPVLAARSSDGDAAKVPAAVTLADPIAVARCWRPRTSPLFAMDFVVGGVLDPAALPSADDVSLFGDVCAVTCADLGSKRDGTGGSWTPLGPTLRMCLASGEWALATTTSVLPLSVPSSVGDGGTDAVDSFLEAVYTPLPASSGMRSACINAAAAPQSVNASSIRLTMCGDAVHVAFALPPVPAWAPVYQQLMNEQAPQNLTAAPAAESAMAASWRSSPEAAAQRAALQLHAAHGAARYVISYTSALAAGASTEACFAAAATLLPDGGAIIASVPIATLAETPAMQQAGTASTSAFVRQARVALANATALACGGDAGATLGIHFGVTVQAVGTAGTVGIPSWPVRELDAAMEGTSVACGFLVAAPSSRGMEDTRVGEPGGGAMPVLSRDSGLLLISDSGPPQGVTIALPQPPAPGEEVTLSCSVSTSPDSDDSPVVALSSVWPSTATAGTLATGATGVQLRLTSGAGALPVAAASSAGSPTGPSAQLIVAAVPCRNGSAPAAAAFTVLCAAVSSLAPSAAGPAVYSAVSPLLLAGVARCSAWPFFSDALLHLPALGGYRSAWGDVARITAPRNGSDGSAAAANTSVTTAAAGNPQEASGALPAWLVTERVQSAPHLLAVPPPPSGFFALTLTSAFNITLVGDTLQRMVAGPHFPPGTRVTVGGMECAVHWRAADGSALTFETPSYAALCGDVRDNAVCGRQALRIITPAAAALNDSSSGTVLPAMLARGGVSVACPPFCPGLAGSLMPFALEPGQLVAVDGAAGGAVVSDSAVWGYGITYVAECTGSAWEDPSSGVCQSLTAPPYALARCGIGYGDSCRRCPYAAAVCPGGERLWPRPGYWVSEESMPASLMRCWPPADRCAGWNVGSSTVACGPGYRHGSQGCSACADGYFPAFDGSCEVCPAQRDVRSIWMPLTLFAAAVLAVLTVVTVGVVAAMKAAGGGSFGRGLMRGWLFTWWMIQTFQLVVQVTKAAAPGLPPYLRAVLASLSKFQLDGVTAHPACTTSTPFLGDAVRMGAGLGLALMLVGLVGLPASAALARQCMLHVRSRRRWGRAGPPAAAGAGRREQFRAARLAMTENPLAARAAARASIHVAAGNPDTMVPMPMMASSTDAGGPTRHLRGPGRWAVAAWHAAYVGTLYLLVLAYPLATNSALSVLACERQQRTVRSYLGLQQSGATLTAAGLDAGEAAAALAAGGSATAAQLALLSTPLQPLVMSSNGYVVCFESLHRPVASLAFACLAVCVLGFPVLSAAAVVWRIRYQLGTDHRAWVRHEAAKQADALRQQAWVEEGDNLVARTARSVAAAWCGAGKRYIAAEKTVPGDAGGPASRPPDFSLGFASAAPRKARQSLAYQAVAGEAATFMFSNPDSGGARPATASAVTGGQAHAGVTTAADVLDSCATVTGDPYLAFFTARGFRASAADSQQLQLLVVLALSVIMVLMERPAGAPQAAAKLGLTVAVTVGVSALWLVRQPYSATQTWKMPPKITAMALATCQAVLNFFNTLHGFDTADDAAGAGTTASELKAPLVVTVLSYATLVGCCLLFAVLVVSFWRAQLAGARRDKSHAVEAAASAAAAAAALRKRRTARRGALVPAATHMRVHTGQALTLSPVGAASDAVQPPSHASGEASRLPASASRLRLLGSSGVEDGGSDAFRRDGDNCGGGNGSVPVTPGTASRQAERFIDALSGGEDGGRQVFRAMRARGHADAGQVFQSAVRNHASRPRTQVVVMGTTSLSGPSSGTAPGTQDARVRGTRGSFVLPQSPANHRVNSSQPGSGRLRVSQPVSTAAGAASRAAAASPAAGTPPVPSAQVNMARLYGNNPLAVASTMRRHRERDRTPAQRGSILASAGTASQLHTGRPLASVHHGAATGEAAE
jgi:hypothetical protein